VLDGCRFMRTADLQSSAVVELLAELRRAGKSIKTVNDYLAAAKSFTRWLWRDKRTAVDALAGLAKLSNGKPIFATRGGTCKPMNCGGC
jgi:site-specific recombinase XerC